MGLFGLFSKEKKESLDKGLEKTKSGLLNRIAKSVIGENDRR
jgi:fused signal recognition particle receptor